MNLKEIVQEFELPQPTKVTALTGGANNRVYKLEFEGQDPVAVKHYFQHRCDPRPRLKAEFSFLQYAWQVGIRNIPKALFSSSKLNTAVYSFIPGKTANAASDAWIQEMIIFFQELNRHKSEGEHLPQASESCFCIEDYFQITERRLERLKRAPIETGLEKELSSFLTYELIPQWNVIKKWQNKAADSPDRCITPSDFGFHNTLVDESNRLFFIDFEYAGWDDPCKTVCDLFCQPKIPIPDHYLPLISQAFASLTQHPERCIERMKLILPVIQMKWCCILLNIFTKVGKDRRVFSHSDELEPLEKQLTAAKQLLSKIQEFSWPT